MRKFTLAILASLVAGAALAAAPKVLETDWTWNKYYASSTASSSTHSVTGVGFGYSIEAIGAAATYTIHFTTRTYDPSKDYGAIRSSTTVDTVTADTTLSADFEALTLDPSIVIHGFSGGTVKIRMTYGENRSNP